MTAYAQPLSSCLPALSRACDPGKKSARLLVTGAGHIPGDDLLSQDLSSHYHRRCGVSLPGSEWDRVVPPRSGHQRAILFDQDWTPGTSSLPLLSVRFSGSRGPMPALLFSENFQLENLQLLQCPLPGIHTENFKFISTATTTTREPLAAACIHQFKNRNQAERMISTSRLNMLPHLYLKPINVVVSDDPSGKIHLGSGLALRCFQRLSIPYLATRPCP